MRNRLHLLRLGTMVMFVACPTPTIAAADRCEPQVAKIVSLQGGIEARRAGEIQWQPAGLNDTYCPGDTVRVRERSRAALVLINETVLRLDQNTTVTFPELEAKEISLLDLLTGAIHFFSRVPRTLKVNTPFVNAAVEGTEFFIRVKKDQATLTVFEGEVVASNKQGRLILRSGESAVAAAGEAPKPRVVVRPRDAVQWALYYPAIVDYRPADFREADWQGMVRRSIEAYRQGDLAGAFASIQGAPKDITDPRFFTYRAALLLTVGRIDDASADIHKALNLAPNNSHAFALQAIIAVVQNDKDKAFDLAIKAVAFDPESAAAKVALSYAQQAGFDLQAALASLQDAVKLRPDNALAWARLSELWLSVGDLDKALEAAAQAVSLNPNLARTQTVLGFAYLTQIKVEDAKQAFEQAIILDQAAPLPRLGLGLAKIREGDLEAGRREIEIAVSLDPNNSLIRSYLGKAYYEEKRDKLAASQYATAKELDPLDPTPWFYDAIRKQTLNRPVEALHDLQKSIELNDNRAVYRSRLLLDQDLAARSSRLGRVYRDLGFEQLALVEGWKSTLAEPADHSGHRFLADTYAVLPRHELARDSELLQAQLLQPINANALEPRLASNGLSFLNDSSFVEFGFNDFTRLFTVDRLNVQVDGLVGSQDTLSSNIVLTGIHRKFSHSVGQFHFETDGFRENNELKQDIATALVQVNMTPDSMFQIEVRKDDRERGDTSLLFEPELFLPDLNEEFDLDTARLGFRHSFSPRSTLIGAFTQRDLDDRLDLGGGMKRGIREDNRLFEIRHFYRSDRLRFTSGLGYFDDDVDFEVIIPASSPIEGETKVKHGNIYSYADIEIAWNATLTVGLSADFFEIEDLDNELDQTSPKLGLFWDVTNQTTVRAAAFRVLKRTASSNQTIERTNVAGFNQFFDDFNGVDSKHYGLAADHQFSARLNGGAEFKKVDSDVRGGLLTPDPMTFDREEKSGRAYLYWVPTDLWALSAEYNLERTSRDLDLLRKERSAPVRTRRLALESRYFHPKGYFWGLRGTYIDQDAEFVDQLGELVKGSDRFWLFDGYVGYRFAKRRGLITIEMRNIFDEEFRFQDRDPSNSSVSPEQATFFKFRLDF